MAEDEIVLIMNPVHLEDEELDYEMSIRIDIGTIPQDGVLSKAYRVLRRLDMDAQSGKTPAERTKEFDAEQLETELQVCQGKVTDLNDLIDQCLVTPDIPSAVWYATASRLVHYDHRLARIDQENEIVTQPHKEQTKRLNDLITKCKKIVTLVIERMPPTNGQKTFTVEPSDATPENGETLDSSTKKNPADESTPSVQSQPGNMNPGISAELREEEEERKKERIQMIDMACKKSERLHSEIEAIIISATGLEKDTQLPHLLEELRLVESMIRGQRITPADHTEVRDRTNRVMRDVLQNIAWLEKTIVQNQQIREQQARLHHIPEAQSTMRNGNVGTEPFNQQIDRLSLRDSFRGIPRLDEDMRNGDLAPESRRNTQHVRFENEGIRETPRRSRGNVDAPEMVEPHRSPDYQPDRRQRELNRNTQPERYGQYQAHRNPTHQRNDYRTPRQNDREWNIYHPATPSRRVEPVNEEVPDDAWLTYGKEMNAGQRQQYLSKLLGNRRFSGEYNSQNKQSISMDEFLNHVRSCQQSTGWSDRLVLSLLASSVSDKAYIWWTSKQKEIFKIDDLEVSMRRRFGGQSMDRVAQIKEFSLREQGENEDILDYMDVMRMKAERMQPPLEETQVIRTIVDNANDAHRGLLLARAYTTVNELNLYMEHLPALRLGKHRENSHSQSNRKSYPKYKTVHAIETETPSNENQSADESEETDSTQQAVEAFVDFIQRKSGNSRPNKQSKYTQRTDQKNKSPEQQPEPPNVAIDRTEFKCFGCGAPNVMRRNCEICQQPAQQSKNGAAELNSTQQ